MKAVNHNVCFQLPKPGGEHLITIIPESRTLSFKISQNTGG